jgi:hypothetical protein
MVELVPYVAATQALNATDSLTASITMEGLLFASFAVGNQLAEVSVRGRSTFFTQGHFGKVLVAIIALVALAACVSWVEVFGFGVPSTPGEGLLALGLAVGILAQPAVAGIINWQTESDPKPDH